MSLVLLQRSVLDTWTAVAAKNPECGSRVLFDTQGIDSWDEKEQRLLWDSVSKCALECAAKYLKPQRLRHMLQTKLARLGD